MTKGQKKQLKTLIILLITVIIVVIAYVLIMNRGKNEVEEEDTSNITEETLVSYANEDIKSIRITNQYGDMSFVIDSEDVVRYENDKDMPINQTYGNNVFQGMNNLITTNKLGEVEQLSDYGLDNPSIQVTVTLMDGTKKVIAFGDTVPLTGGHYASIQGDTNVYVVGDTFYNYYNYSLIDMTTVETIENVPSENITHLKVSKKDGEDFEIIYDENNPSDFAKQSFWTVKAPYQISLPGNMEEITTLLSNYTSYSLISCVDYNATDLSIYGLEEPSSVYIEYYEIVTDETEEEVADDTNTETESEQEPESTKIFHQLELFIGNQDDDGNYYVKLKDSKAVNLMSSTDVEKILNINSFSAVNTFINLVNIADISSVDIIVEDKKYNLSIKDESNIAEENKESTLTYYVNGKEIEENTFKDFYQKLISTTIQREIPKEDSDNVYDTTFMTVTYHLLSGDMINVAYKLYDDSYYIVNVDGTEMFLTDFRDVNEIAKLLESLE